MKARVACLLVMLSLSISSHIGAFDLIPERVLVEVSGCTIKAEKGSRYHPPRIIITYTFDLVSWHKRSVRVPPRVAKMDEEGIIDYLELNAPRDVLRILLRCSRMGSLSSGNPGPATALAAGPPIGQMLQAGRRPLDMAAADINGDGIGDIVVVNYASNDVSVLLGRPDGTLDPARNFPVGSGPLRLRIGDFNGDGRADLVTASETGEGGVSLLLGNGDGTFKPAVEISRGGSPQSLEVANLNQDDFADVVVTNSSQSIIAVLFGKGDGTFQNPVNLPLPSSSTAVVAADLDGDGDEDLAAGSGSGISILLGDGRGGFTASQSFTLSTSGAVSDVDYGDFDRDGDVDLVVASRFTNSVSVFLNGGTAGFKNPLHYVVGEAPARVTVGDLDFDTYPDLVVSNDGSEHASVLFGDGDGTFHAGSAYLTADKGAASTSVSAADFNSDGIPDLAVGNILANSVILWGKAGGAFEKHLDLGSEGILSSGDFNQDGKADVALNRRNDAQGFIRPNISVLLGNGDGSFNPPQTILIGDNRFEIGPMVAAQVNRDEFEDLVLLNQRSDALLIYLGNGNGTFQVARQVATAPQPQSIAISDVNRDGNPDVVIACAGPPGTINGKLSLLPGNGDGSFRQGTDLLTGISAWAVAVGDLNGDGNPDLAAAIESPQFSYNLAILLGNGDGSFRAPVNLPSTTYRFSGVGSMQIVDFDQNGFEDLLVLSGGESALLIYPGKGDGTFDEPNFADAGSGLAGMAVTDLNQDRKPDVAAAIGGSMVATLFSVSTGAETNTGLRADKGGAESFITTGNSIPIQVGYATASPDFGVTPYATGVFSLTQNGVVVSEAGVPSSPPTLSARVFIDYQTGVAAIPGQLNAGTIDINTGFAVVNLGPKRANARFTLRDRAGNMLASGNGTLDAGAHVAKFIHQLGEVAPDFNLPANFATAVQFGSLDISADQPLSVLALRLTINQRGEALLTTTPIADLSQVPPSGPVYFPQMVDGGGFTTTVILINTSTATETGTLQIIGDDGNPLAVRRVGGASSSSFDYSIPAGGAFVFQTDGSPATTNIGWARVTPAGNTPTPVGAGVFQFSPGGILVTESGVPAALPTTRARIFVDKSGGHDTGLALAIPGGAGATVTLTAFQTDGVTAAGSNTGVLNLNGNGHKAEFVGQRITGLPDGFRGVLEISSNTPFVALTLRSLVNARGDFLITTFPIADLGRAAPLPMIFPQAVDGSGYQTEFIFIAALGEALATLNYFGDDGRPLRLDRK